MFNLFINLKLIFILLNFRKKTERNCSCKRINFGFEFDPSIITQEA
jgi:hypothetical protein